jgi:hypothetical protein
VTEVERYLASVEARIRGTGARRLCAELRDHIDDAIAHQRAAGCDPDAAARIALERAGPPDELVDAWIAHTRLRRVRTRRRAGLVAFAAVTASALALVQHASGREPGGGAGIVTVPAATHCLSASTHPAGLSAFRRWAERPIAGPPRAVDDSGGSRRSGANPFRCERR